MFDFFSMADNYEERKVARYDGKNGLCVDTALVTDSEKDYETGITHPSYNEGSWVIVELYDTEEEAKAGHDIWVKRMTGKKLPGQLKDVSSCTIAELIDAVSSEDDNWREQPKKKQKKKEKK